MLRDIQAKVTLGEEMLIVLINGREISGKLVGLHLEHLVLAGDAGDTAIKESMIGMWQHAVAAKDSPKPISDIPPSVAQMAQPVIIAAEKKVEYSPVPANFMGRLFEINKKFAEENFSKQSLPAVSFKPEKEDPAGKLACADAWSRLKNKYEYALRIKELGSNFGRVQYILGGLRDLAKEQPKSPSAWRHLGYIASITDNKNEALEAYRQAAKLSNSSEDFLAIALIATDKGADSLAAVALENFFLTVRPTENLEAWRHFVNLAWKNKSLDIVRETYARLEAEDVDSLQEYLDAAVFLSGRIEGDKAACQLLNELENTSPRLAMDDFFKKEIYGSEEFTALREAFLDQMLGDIAAPEQGVDGAVRISGSCTKGTIYRFKNEKNYGFISDEERHQFFFHFNEIIDPELEIAVRKMQTGEEIDVFFQKKNLRQGPVATNIFRSIENLVKEALAAETVGEYGTAISIARRVMLFVPDHPLIGERIDKWREYQRITGLPRGSNAYARAKRLQIVSKDLEGAAELYLQAIKNNDNRDSAVKDLASIYQQLNRTEDAITLLENQIGKLKEQSAAENQLIQYYQIVGRFDDAINILAKKVVNTKVGSVARKTIMGQLAFCQIKAEKFAEAEVNLRGLIKQSVDKEPVLLRNLAIALFHQGKLEEAERILGNLIKSGADLKAKEILDNMKQAGESGGSVTVIDMEMEMPVFASELSGYTNFFLERNAFEGVSPELVLNNAFKESDLKRLEDLAASFGFKRPRERSEYYISAARIRKLLDDDYSPQFYRYIGRGFASKADAIVMGNRNLDVAAELYCEALAAYDGCIRSDLHDKDANFAIVKYLYAMAKNLSVPYGTQNMPGIEEALVEIFNRANNALQVMLSLQYLAMRSRVAANKLTSKIFGMPDIMAETLRFFREENNMPVASNINSKAYREAWERLAEKMSSDYRSHCSEIRYIDNIDICQGTLLEDTIIRLERLSPLLFFAVDQQRIRSLRDIINRLLELCSQSTFEEQERCCYQVERGCDDYINGISENPTRFSVEELLPIVGNLRKKVGDRLEELYQTSSPQLSIRLANGLESYSPDPNEIIEVQIVVENQSGCSPAAELELIIQPEDEVFSQLNPCIRVSEGLRGGEQKILIAKLQVSKQALVDESFTLILYGRFKARTGEELHTEAESLAIRLYSSSSFERIENPFAAYAEGGVVAISEMFYGRNELIENIIHAVVSSRQAGKCVVIYGQKRAGKSSILFHLDDKLKTQEKLIVLNIGNIGSVLDENSKIDMLYLIFWEIISRLQYSLKKDVENGLPDLGLDFPDFEKFTGSASPLGYFRDFFNRFKHAKACYPEYNDTKVVLLIDEFTYIYELILKKKINPNFMKNWKALLQEDCFSAILVGQDVMPKFKKAFPNEFGTTQDERVTYLREEDAIQLMDEPIRIGGKCGESRYREKAREKIADLSAKSPFYIQMICNRLVEHMNRKCARYVTDADVEQVKNDLIKGVNALGIDKFDNLINSGDTSTEAISDKDVIKIMREIARNSGKTACPMEMIRVETENPVESILEDLVNRDVLELERGSFYRIKVGLFKEWLLENEI